MYSIDFIVHLKGTKNSYYRANPLNCSYVTEQVILNAFLLCTQL